MKKMIASVLVVVLLLSGCLAYASGSEASDSVCVYVTVSNKGQIPVSSTGTLMQYVPVTVHGATEGSVTVDEVLSALHDTYCPEGYEIAISNWGTSVTKLWNNTEGNFLFFINHAGLPTSVSTDRLTDGDYLVASVNQDSSYYADWYTYFKNEVTIIDENGTESEGEASDGTVSLYRDQSLRISLEGHLGMAFSDEDKRDIPLCDVQVGTIEEDGSLSYLYDEAGEALVTDETGAVTLFFPETGEYVISGNGTVQDTVMDFITGENVEANCPIIAPILKVVVTEREITPETAWEGMGTEDDPYLLEDPADLNMLKTFVNEDGNSFLNSYFLLTEDISLPDEWNGIGSLKSGCDSADRGVNLNPFSGTIDGGGHTVSYPYGGQALIGYAREATVKNLTIYAPYAADNGLLTNYVVDYGTDGDYRTGCPKTLTVENVTLKEGSVVLKSGFVSGYASGDNQVIISGSTVEENVKIGFDAERNESAGLSYVGSFCGECNGKISDSTSSATVYGVDYVGGIAGCKGQSAGLCSVVNCSFFGDVISSGKHVGGILGGGYGGAGWGVETAPNTPGTSVENCLVMGDVSGNSHVGGIFGGEEGCVQLWENAFICNNVFKGNLSSETDVAGAIIGYMHSLNRNNVIKNNYYFGEENQVGIGAVSYVDTSYARHETDSEAVYFDSSQEGATLPAEATKTDLNRRDDPLGKDRENLTKAMAEDDFKDGTVLNLLNDKEEQYASWLQGKEMPHLGGLTHLIELSLSGEYKTSYEYGEDLDLSGMDLTLTWSDETETEIDIDSAIITGYDKFEKGEQDVTVSYGGEKTEFSVKVKGRNYNGHGSSGFVISEDVTVLPKEKDEGTASPDTTVFRDVKASDWFYDSVNLMVSKGLMRGTGENEFMPNERLTRGMFITILHRMAGTPDGFDGHFSDVLPSAYYSQAVAWGNHMGIIAGLGDGTFGAEGNISREALAVMMYRYAKALDAVESDTENLTKFADADTIHEWARKALSWAVETGLLNGRDGNCLAPQAETTRAETATVFMRFLSLVGNSERE